MSKHTPMALANTRASLIAGNLSDLPSLVIQTEELIQRLPVQKNDMATLRELRKQARRNLHLLDAARRGFRDARERRVQIEDVAQGLKTYNRSGSFRPRTQPGRLEHKS